MVKSVRICLGDWETWRQVASDIRTKVFVKEQGIPHQIEMDNEDERGRHAVAVDLAGRFMGTGRLLSGGYIGRMAVLPKHRGKGVGGAILQALLEASYGRGDAENVISAQIHAVPFYARYGFVEEGEEYDEAGISHITMRRIPSS